MVLTVAQTTSFFEQGAQMGIPHATVIQLQAEGFEAVSDLANFDKDSLQQLPDNLQFPGGQVPDPNPGVAIEAMIPTPSFVFSAKSQKRIAMACDLVHYYNMVGCDLNAVNLQWMPVMKNLKHSGRP